MADLLAYLDHSDIAFAVAVLGLAAFGLAPSRAWDALTRRDR